MHGKAQGGERAKPAGVLIEGKAVSLHVRKPTRVALTEAALEEIREAIYEPRTTLAKVRRHVGRILGKLREQTSEDAEPEESVKRSKAR
jgi:uncharacterized coiled-coil protein SlyX